MLLLLLLLLLPPMRTVCCEDLSVPRAFMTALCVLGQSECTWRSLSHVL